MATSGRFVYLSQNLGFLRWSICLPRQQASVAATVQERLW